MKNLTVLVVLSLFLPITSHAYEYRDRFGNLVYTGERSGNQTIYRDRYGNTFETETRERDRNVYRDRFGNSIGDDNEE